MRDDRTIVAVSSAVGHGARLIVRISGPQARHVASSLCPGWTLHPNRASREKVAAGGLTFPAWLYAFEGPRSYTGEDSVELHLPGNPVLARLTVDRVIQLGARLAEPGEFTARAYFNGRMDLTEAEGVAATVAASNEDELRAARQLMAGGLAKRLRPLMDRLAETLGLVEVGIDFVDEDVTFLPAEEVAERARAIDADLAQLLAESDRMERLSAEPTVVLVGRPNAGKSTLLNTLAGHERAVVSPIAGTTRDVLSAEAPLIRGLVRLVDAAGLDDAETPNDSAPSFSRGPGGHASPPDSPDPALAQIEREMRRRALDAVQQADIVLLVQDVTDPRPPLDVGRPPDLTVRTKADQHHAPLGQLGVSALTGQGLDHLRSRLDDLAFGKSGGGERLALNRRHLKSITDARTALQRVDPASPVEVTALDLREALDALGNVLGVISPDDVLGLVFARFCIGK